MRAGHRRAHPILWGLVAAAIVVGLVAAIGRLGVAP
jgi:hypothetical protein